MTAADTQALVSEIAGEFARLPEVVAVALSGSSGSGLSDGGSDLDLYVYAGREPSLEWRAGLAQKFGSHAGIGNNFWEPGDEWVALRNGCVVDIMYRSPAWMEQQFERILVQHQASVGYSTCFVYNVLHSKPLYDPDNWFAALRAQAELPYPEPLRRAIVARNHPILRSTLSSYEHQIELALQRCDWVSVNHRITALLASYFDILFALNRLFHPGEKRLVAYVQTKCPKRPPDFALQVDELLAAIAPPGRAEVLGRVHALLDGLDALLIEEELIVPRVAAAAPQDG